MERVSRSCPDCRWSDWLDALCARSLRNSELPPQKEEEEKETGQEIQRTRRQTNRYRPPTSFANLQSLESVAASNWVVVHSFRRKPNQPMLNEYIPPGKCIAVSMRVCLPTLQLIYIILLLVVFDNKGANRRISQHFCTPNNA